MDASPLAETAPDHGRLLILETMEPSQLNAVSQHPAPDPDDDISIPRQPSWFAGDSNLPVDHDWDMVVDDRATSPDMDAHPRGLRGQPQDSFDSASAHFSHSPPPRDPQPFMPQLPRLKRAAQAFSRRSARLQPLRQEMMLLRDRARFELEERRNHRHHVEESQTALLAALSNVLEHLPDVPAFEEACRLHRQLLADQDALVTQADKTAIIDDEMSALYYRISKRETALDKSASTLLDITESIDGTPTDDPNLTSALNSPPVTPDHEVSSPPEFHPLLSNFFDKAGNFKIMQERFQEVQAMHAEARRVRESQYDQGRSPIVPDDAFEAACNQEYQQARHNALAAMEAQERAQMSCEQQGISVEPYLQPLPDLEYLISEHSSAQHASERAVSPAASSVDFRVLTPEMAQHSTLALNDLLQAYGDSESRSRGPGEDPTADKTEAIKESLIAEWIGGIHAGEGEGRRSEDLFKTKPRPVSVRSQPAMGSDLLHRYLTRSPDSRGFDLGKSPASFAHRLVTARRSSSSDLSSMRHYSHEDILKDLKAARDA